MRVLDHQGSVIGKLGRGVSLAQDEVACRADQGSAAKAEPSQLVGMHPSVVVVVSVVRFQKIWRQHCCNGNEQEGSFQGLTSQVNAKRGAIKIPNSNGTRFL